MELGGVQTLCALLRSDRDRVVYEASCALSFISSLHDPHKLLIVDNNGCVIYHSINSSYVIIQVG